MYGLEHKNNTIQTRVLNEIIIIGINTFINKHLLMRAQNLEKYPAPTYADVQMSLPMG